MPATDQHVHPTHPVPLNRFLQRQRMRRYLFAAVTALVLGGVLIARAPWRANRWPGATRKLGRVTQIEDTGRLHLDRPIAGNARIVSLLGVRIDEGHRHAPARLRELALGQNVIVELPQPHAQTNDGCPVGYVYLTDGRMLNPLLIREGLASIDASVCHALSRWFATLAPTHE